MTHLEQAINWMELDKRCGAIAGHCLKCDAILKERFDTADAQTRNFLVQILCSCRLEDFYEHEPLSWLIALLNSVESDRFVAHIVTLAPYSRERALQVVRLSQYHKGNWCFGLEPNHRRQFWPRFHLHPALAPILLEALVRPETEMDDTIALLDYFYPIADRHSALQIVLPLWQERKAREEDARKAEYLRQQERQRLELEQLKAKRLAREKEFQKVEAAGPEAILRSILEAPTLGTWDCCDRWAGIPEMALRGLSAELLRSVAQRISNADPSRRWIGCRNRIEFLINSRARSAQRSARLGELESLPTVDKLWAICFSEWPLTYFPESWAEEVFQTGSVLADDLRTELLKKCTRLRKRGRWRKLRQTLLGTRRREQ